MKDLIRRAAELLSVNHGTHRGWVRLLLAEASYTSGVLDSWCRLNPPQVRRVVFVCLGNINRSAFAEAVGHREGLNTISIGLSTSTGVPAYESAVRIAPSFGIDLGSHRATDITDYQHREGDLLAAMEIRHVRQLLSRGIPERSVILLGRWARPMRIHIHDPHTLSDAYFHTCFAILQSAVRGLAEDLRSGGHPAAGF